MSDTTNLLITKPETGQAQPQVTIATGFEDFDTAIAGSLSKSITTANVTLSDDEARAAIISLSGTLTGNRDLIVPTRTKIYSVYNGTSGAFTVTVKTSGGTGVVVVQGTRQFVYCDGTDVVLLGAPTLTVKESDGSPSITNVNTIKVSNGTLTDNGGGVVTIAVGSGGALDDLSDVTITSPATDDVLKFNGSIWINDTAPGGGGGGSDFTAPVLADFSFTNQGGATATQTDIWVGAMKINGVAFLAPAGGSDNLRQLLKTAPTPPYTIVLAFVPFFYQADFSQMGFCWAESSPGKIGGGVIARNSGLKYRSELWTNATTYSGNYASKAFDYLPALIWIKAVDDNTNRKIYVAGYGEDWQLLHSVARTTDFTPGKVGFFIDNNNSGFDASMGLVHWEES